MSTDIATINRVSRLWTVMQAHFGSRWLLDYGDAIEPATGHLGAIAAVWAATLETVSNNAIANGLKALLSRQSEYPPTLPEFMRLCGARIPSTHASHQLLPGAPAQSNPNQSNPDQRCALLSSALIDMAGTELTTRLTSVQPDDRKQVISSYWSTKLAAITHDKANDALPADWRTLAGIPEPPLQNKRRPGAIPSLGETLTALYPEPAQETKTEAA